MQILHQNLNLPKWVESRRDPFETLVKTILSQNTADRNTAKAFESLSKQFEIAPEALAKAPLKQIEIAIRVAGLYKSKARAIEQAAAIIFEKHGGTLNSILSLSLEEARGVLRQFPGVGPKTADVVLLFSANMPTIPIDTHVSRIAKRLGFATPNSNYETIRQNLQSLFDAHEYLVVHLLFIAHGRKYCKARCPKCEECPIAECCPSRGMWT